MEGVAMRKVLLGGFLLVLLILVRGTAPGVVEAQGKKGGTTGVIEIGEGKDGKFRFFVRDAEDKLVAMSSPGGFASVKDAQAAIDRLKEIVSKAKVTILKKDSKKSKKDK
jgi:hypothetical protein